MSIFTLTLGLLGCSNGFFGNAGDPDPDTGIEADADADADADSDTDADADADSDSDADGDTDVDGDDIDDDGDGLTENEGDCDDTDSDVSPNAEETPYNDVDDDCDPETPDDDLDGDGYLAEDDCDDDDAEAAPDLTEDPTDGKDNDCDGKVDERFDIETADATGDMGYVSALDTDSSNNVHIAYLDADNFNVLYANRTTGGSWTTGTTIDSTYGTGLYISAEVDGADRFQVGYTYGDSSVGFWLWYNYRSSSGTWGSGYYVDQSTDDVGAFVDIAVDPSSNYPNFLYLDGTGDYNLTDFLDLNYTVPVLAAFKDVTLTSVEAKIQTDASTLDNTGWFTTLAVDSSGDYHGAWVDYGAGWGAGELQYGNMSLSSFSATVSETIWTGTATWASMALKSDGTPCVAWQDFDNMDVMYGCRTGEDTWSNETVESTGAVGEGTQMAFNSSDEPYIAYYNETSGALRMAHKTSDGWTTFQVDGADGNVGQFPSIAVDSADVVHVSYYDVDHGYLMYAQGK